MTEYRTKSTKKSVYINIKRVHYEHQVEVGTEENCTKQLGDVRRIRKGPVCEHS